MGIFKRARIFLDFAGGHDNPSAIHSEGISAKKRLENARERLARLLHVQMKEIVFTSGGTESDNLAILGVFEFAKQSVSRPHIIISSVEHSAVSEVAKEVERRGGEVTVVELEDGVVNANTVLKAIKDNTVLISIVYANSHTGGINPIPKITRLVREVRNKNNSKYPLVHTYATQTLGLLEVSFPKLGADLVTLDASKISGPKGVSTLIVRSNVSIRPIIFGGGQEFGLRSGTENLDAIEKFVRVVEDSEKTREKNFTKLFGLKKLFLSEVRLALPEAVINTPQVSLPNMVSLSIPGALHEFLVIKLDDRGVAASTGSACLFRKSDGDTDAIRFSFGIKNTESEIKRAVRILKDVVL